MTEVGVTACGDGRVHGSHSWEQTQEDGSTWHQCRGVRTVSFDPYRYAIPVADVTGMTSPYRCTRCQHVHDVGRITEWGRYLDCSTWRCPGCGSLIDDRPISWGGSAIPLDQEGREKR